MPSLAHRLKQVQKPPEAPDHFLGHDMSLMQLRELKVNWGNVGKGKTFQQMWEGDQHWVYWTVCHLKSPTHQQKLFLTFVENMVDRLEASGTKVTVTPERKHDNLTPEREEVGQGSQSELTRQLVLLQDRVRDIDALLSQLLEQQVEPTN